MLSEIHMESWRATNSDGDDRTQETRRKASLSWLTDEVNLNFLQQWSVEWYSSLSQANSTWAAQTTGEAEEQSGFEVLQPLPSCVSSGR